MGKTLTGHAIREMSIMLHEGDLIYMDTLDRLGRDYDGIISEWKYITSTIGADIIYLDNESLFDSGKFKTWEAKINFWRINF